MKKLILTCFTSIALLYGSQAQTTVTITATGATGSFNTGSVNSAGVKNDGNMININTSANAGWAKFDLTSIPASAVVTAATCVFTTYTTTSSGITNNLYGFVGDPAVIAGVTLYSNCNTGTTLNASTWAANAINTKILNAAGVNFVGSNLSSNQVCIGYSRASTNNYNIYGYPGTLGSQPMMVITYSVPPVCSGLPNAGTAIASNTFLCSSQNVNLNLTGSTSASGLSYQWLSSPDGTTWSPIPTATIIATTQSVTATTYYQCAVACGTNVAASSIVTITVGGTPNAGTTAATSTFVCFGQTVALSLSGASIYPGLTYQWQSSPTGTGFTAIVPTASLATTSQSMTTSLYFRNVLTCGSATAASTPIQVQVASTTTNTIPYFEGFEGITLNNQLPNCSWAASNLPTICKTYTAATGSYNQMPKTGSKFGSFRYGTATTGDYFYTNGLQLTAGTNYIATTDYIADGLSGWSEFSLLVGSSQSTVGLSNIASITGAITNTVYANVNGTFSVSTTGIYYIAIKAIGNSTPWYLSFDDVKVIAAPTCTLAPFAGTISGATTVNTGTTNSYSVSPATGNIQWYSASTSTGPWSPIGSATLATNQTITAVGSGTVYYTTIASSLGCPNDTSNVPLAVTVNFPGDNTCSPIALTTGTSSVYSLLGATTQTGEVTPTSTGGCSTNNSWCNSMLNGTMWFTFVAPASGNISVQSPGFDTQLAIWSTTNCANLIGQATPTAPVGATLIAANDDDANYIANSGANFSSYVRAACLTPGTTYYIQLDSYGAATASSTTSIIITDLGAMNASFTGVNPTYCLPTTSSSLTPATAGGLFTVNNGTTAVTSFSPTSAGSYTVTYSIFGCVSNSTTAVNITPTISATPSSSAICAGSSATVTVSGATTYSWSPSATLSSSTGSLVVASPTVSTSYTITGYNGVCSNLFSGTLVVNPVPSLTVSPASTTICPGNTITLTASGSDTYTWSNGPTTTTTSVSPTSLTVYTVTSTNSCGSSTATATVNVSSAVSVNATSSSTLLCSGQSATLTANGASSYTWMPAGSGASIVVSPTTTATYTVMGSSSCGSASTTVTQNVSLCTGVAQALTSTQVSLYPNPNYGVVTIELASELIQNASILIYDALGKIVITEKLTTEITAVKMAQLDNGVYFYKVISNNQDVKIGKIVKQ